MGLEAVWRRLKSKGEVRRQRNSMQTIVFNKFGYNEEQRKRLVVRESA